MHLFNKENIWSNPCSPLHTFNHPDKYKNNNSVNRIIFQRKGERRDTKKDTSRTSFQLESKNVSSVSTRSPSNYNYKINSTYRINSTTRNFKEIQELQGSLRTGSLPAVPPRASKHSTRQNQAPRLLQHRQASSNSTRQKQHSTRQPAYTQPFQ